MKEKKVTKKKKEDIQVEKILTKMDKEGDKIQKANNKTGSWGDWGLGFTIAGLLWGFLMYIGVILSIAHLLLTKKGDKGRKSAVIAIVLFVILFVLMILTQL